MANNKTVAPEDMGSGLILNSTAKQWQVNPDEDNAVTLSGGKVKVKLSASSGNLIRMMSDGLYYGETARANIANLYVDADNGVDQDPNVVSGAGSREKPLKTIYYANSLAEAGTIRTIYLKEKQQHEISAKKIVNVKSGTLSFRIYGDEFDKLAENTTDKTYIGGQLAQTASIQPSIKFTNCTTEAYNNGSTFNGDVVNLWCMILEKGATLNVYSVDFINDLTFTEHVSATVNTSRTTSVVRPFRIYGADANVFLSHQKYKTVEGGSIKLSLTGSNDIEDTIMTDKTDGFLGISILYLGVGELKVRGKEIVKSTGCHLIGDPGWLGALSSSLSFTRLISSDSELAKLITGVTTKTIGSNKIVLAPITDIDGDLF